MENKRKTGKRYEDMAASYLTEQGLRIVEQNYFCPAGEIDLIAEDGDAIVFVEVKYRRTAGSGYAASAVTAQKQKTLYQCARFYIAHRGLSFDQSYRFDVIAIDGSKITWIRDCVQA